FFHGIVTYLRPMESSARKIDMGVTSPWMEYIKVYPDAWSEFQKDIALKARETSKVTEYRRKVDGKLTKFEKTVIGGSLWSDAQEASTFVYPDGTYGKEGFEKWIVKKVPTMKGTKETYVLHPTLAKELTSVEAIAKY